MTLMVLRVLIAASYSYKMLIEPASKVSVPFTVVTVSAGVVIPVEPASVIAMLVHQFRLSGDNIN
jgi:hypothetical protein